MKEYIVGIENEHPHALDVCYKKELIRCKDCKYDHTCTHEMVRKLPGGSLMYCPVEYCSEGERRTDG